VVSIKISPLHNTIKRNVGILTVHQFLSPGNVGKTNYYLVSLNYDILNKEDDIAGFSFSVYKEQFIKINY